MSRSTLEVTATRPQHWQYVSEGGATIVLSYTGQHPQFLRKVLRLRKRLLGSVSTSDGQGDDDGEVSVLTFQKKIIGRLVPPEFLPVLEYVSVDRPWLEEIASVCDQHRPLGRREQDGIDLTQTRAILATDLVGDVPLVVEIKPKWSFLPSPYHLSPASAPIKLRTCRFCMHSHLKTTDHENVHAGYCPLDLFSGNEDRISRALHALWDAWIHTQGSANNFRIFSRGKLLKPNDPELRTSIPHELEQITAQIHASFSENLIQVLTQELKSTSALYILSKLQRELDPLDIEGLSQLWKRSQVESLTEHHPSSPPILPPLFSGLAQPSLSDWESFVDVYLSSHSILDHSVPLAPNLRYYTLAYLLSATFKDCSIMIKLSHPSDPGQITLIDLEPKSVTKLPQWEKLDATIVQAYAGVQEKLCIDAWKLSDK